MTSIALKAPKLYEYETCIQCQKQLRVWGVHDKALVGKWGSFLTSKKDIKKTIGSLAKHGNSWSTTFSWLIYRLLAEYTTTQSRISHPVVFIVGQLELWRDIYPCDVTFVWRYTQTKHGKASLQRCSQRQNKYKATYS